MISLPWNYQPLSRFAKLSRPSGFLQKASHE
jgi:hypothetical protein